jgi:hypothetical protein
MLRIRQSNQKAAGMRAPAAFISNPGLAGGNQAAGALIDQKYIRLKEL